MGVNTGVSSGIAERILWLRGHKVILDRDLAALYGVETRRLNEQVRRNRERFPADFLIEATPEEATGLMSQNATSNRGGHRKPPLAFTEHGALMAASVLSSPQAVEMSIYVVRAFVHLREALAGNRELARKIAELERRIGARLADHDQAIAEILGAIRQLTTPPESRKRPIGFVPPK
ncbi:MAG: ORF6N domain-containing protein [Pseudoxanthomonas sp.]